MLNRLSLSPLIAALGKESKLLTQQLAGKQSSLVQVCGCLVQQVAGVKNIQPPPSYDVELPKQRRLPFLPKVPLYPGSLRPPKMAKRIIEMRGPELVHTDLILKQYGIVALQGGRLKWGHYEMLRMGVIRKIDQKRSFAIWRIDAPWKALTKQGQGKRMGGGKGSISQYCHPVKAGRVIIEVGGKCEFEEVEGYLTMLAEKLPFKAKVVSYESMMKDRAQEKLLTEVNENEYTRKYFIKNNMLGCWNHISNHEVTWEGEFR